MKAIYEQARINISKAKAIHELYETKKERITEATHYQYTIKVLDTLFKKPIFTTTDFIIVSHIPKTSAMWLLNILKKSGIISTFRKGKGRIPEVLIFNKLFNIIALSQTWKKKTVVYHTSHSPQFI